MADIDTKLIGEIFQSVPYSEIIGGPLKAASDAAIKQSREVADFILKVGFNTDKETGVKKAINLSFEHTITSSDGASKTETITMPLLAMIPLPNMQISSGVITLDVEVSQSSEVKENIDAGGEGEGRVGWGPFSISIKAKASYSKENTRKTDTRAKQHIELHLEQAPLPEGMNLVLEILRNRAVDGKALPEKSTAPASLPPGFNPSAIPETNKA